MISIVELIGGISILLASGFLLIFVKESVFDQIDDPDTVQGSSQLDESFIKIDMDKLTHGETPRNAEQVTEKMRRIEAFKLRNKFYQIQ